MLMWSVLKVFPRTHLGARLEPVLAVLFDGVVAEQGETGLADVATADLLVQRHQELFHRRRSVEADHLQSSRNLLQVRTRIYATYLD